MMDRERSYRSIPMEFVTPQGANHWQGFAPLNLSNLNERSPVSFLIFPDQTVESLSARLTAVNSPYLCRLHYIHSMEDGRLVAVVERMSSFENWLVDETKEMWEYSDDGTVCVGMGSDFRQIFSGIALCLKAIHMAGMYGILNTGIFLGENDKNVRLMNIGLSADLWLGMRADLEQFKHLVEEAIERHPVAAGLNLPPEVDLFMELFENYPTDVEGLRQHAFWICHSFLFWGTTKRSLLVEKLWEMRENDVSMFDNKFRLHIGQTAIGPWWLQVPINGPLSAVFNFKNGANSKHYMKQSGILRFMRNSKAHPRSYTIKQIMKQIQDVWPEAIGKCFLELRDRLSYERVGNTSVMDFIMSGPSPFIEAQED